MSATGFEFNSFRRPSVKVEYKPHPSIKDGEGVQLDLNLDLLTLAAMETIEAEFASLFEQAENAPQEPASTAKRSRKNASDVSLIKPAEFTIYQFEKAIFRLRACLLAGKPGENDPDKRFIRSWNVTRGGKKLPVAYESLISMPAKALNDLYLFVTGKANNPTDNEKKTSEAT